MQGYVRTRPYIIADFARLCCVAAALTTHCLGGAARVKTFMPGWGHFGIPLIKKPGRGGTAPARTYGTVDGTELIQALNFASTSCSRTFEC